MNRRSTPEADTQRAIVQALRFALPRDAIVHHCANEVTEAGPRGARRQAILVGMGVHAGFADLIVISSGRVLFLEVKSQTGRLRKSQEVFRDTVVTQGFGWAPEAWIWVSCSPNPAITPAPSWSGRTGPAPSSSQPRAQGISPRPQSGMICAASMRSHYAGPSTSSSLDIPASPSARLEIAVVPMIPGTSGPRSPVSSPNAAPNGSFSKPSPGTLPSALKPSCDSFGQWATRLRRVCSARQKSVRRTGGRASSSWPTPMSLHPGTASYNPAGNSDFTRKAEALALGITNWSTPKATDGAKGGPGQSYGSGGTPPLPAQAAQWPTPAAQNWKGSSEASVTRADGKSRMDILHYRAEQGFIRPAPVITPDGKRFSPHTPISRPLWGSMIASHGHVACRRILKARARRRLNPLFVGWLMGWPIGHALCACSATEFILWQQRTRGALFRLPMASGPWIWRPVDGAEGPAQMSLFEGMPP